MRALHKCETKSMSLFSSLVCSGKPMFTCLRNFCQWSTCPAHPEAKCRINPCGGCKVEFIDKNSKVVDCHEGITKFYMKLEPFNSQDLISNSPYCLP